MRYKWLCAALLVVSFGAALASNNMALFAKRFSHQGPPLPWVDVPATPPGTADLRAPANMANTSPTKITTLEHATAMRALLAEYEIAVERADDLIGWTIEIASYKAYRRHQAECAGKSCLSQIHTRLCYDEKTLKVYAPYGRWKSSRLEFLCEKLCNKTDPSWGAAKTNCNR
jgi:hypothetical protein